MTHRYTFSLLLLFFLSGLRAEVLPNPVMLNFEVKGMPDGFCRIIGMTGNNNYLVDSLECKNGKALYLSSNLLSPGLFYFVLPDEQTYFQFLLDKDQQIEMKTDIADINGHMKVTGSEDNELLYENLEFENTFRKRFDSVDQQIKFFEKQLYKPDLPKLEALRDQLIKDRKAYLESLAKNHPNSFFTQFKLAGQNPDLQYPKKSDGTLDTMQQSYLYRAAYFKNTNLADEKLLRTPVVVNKLKTYITQLIPQNPDSIIKYMVPLIEQSKPCSECFKFIVNWLAIQFEKPSMMGGEKVMVYLIDNYFTDAYAKPWFKENPYELVKIRLRADNMRPSMLGQTGQDLRAKNLNGVYENVYDLKTPIKIVFLYDPDCEHCQKEAPEMAELLKKWQGKIDIYALSLDKDEQKWREFIPKYHTEGFHNVFDPNMESLYYKKYYIDITPEIYVLDPNNKIVAKDLHPNQLDDIFRLVLDKAGIH